MAASIVTTGAQFDSLAYEEGRRWELVGGELIAVSSPTPEHQAILQRILFALMVHLNADPAVGLVFTDVEFALTSMDRVRPDLLVVLHPRAASLAMDRVPVPGAPDLAIEIISPSERNSDTQKKLRTYLANGTREVWQVYPKTRSVEVHRGGSGAGANVMAQDARLATPLLPGFSLGIGEIFGAAGQAS